MLIKNIYRVMLLGVLTLAFLPWDICFCQTDQPVAVEDFKPGSTNQPGRDYPQVNSEGRVRARIAAPKAKGVPHVWHVDGNAHDDFEWVNNLYLFAQHIFRSDSGTDPKGWE